MANELLISKIREYREYKRMIDEMESIVESIADELKAVMVAEGVEKKIIGEYKLSFTEATRKDIDKKRLEAEYSDIYNKLLKETSYKRFTVS